MKDKHDNVTEEIQFEGVEGVKSGPYVFPYPDEFSISICKAAKEYQQELIADSDGEQDGCNEVTAQDVFEWLWQQIPLREVRAYAIGKYGQDAFVWFSGKDEIESGNIFKVFGELYDCGETERAVDFVQMCLNKIN